MNGIKSSSSSTESVSLQRDNSSHVVHNFTVDRFCAVCFGGTTANFALKPIDYLDFPVLRRFESSSFSVYKPVARFKDPTYVKNC